MKAYMGIDVGSVTTKFAVLDEDDEALGTVEVPALWDGENRIVEIDLAKH